MSVAFDIVVVGAGGGPDETNLSAYLLKANAAAWEDGILALEAGSAQGALSRLLSHNPLLFNVSGRDAARTYNTAQIYSFVRSFLISHAHLDHINGLVLAAGSLSGPRRRIHALKKTLQDIETVFSDRIWPNLASWDEDDAEYKLLYSPLLTDDKYKDVHPSISVRTMPLNHGSNASNSCYKSAAFFIRHDVLNREFLFFGDVEPDKLVKKPSNIDVWRASAPKIPHILSVIFIECSWPSGRSDDTLFGHLNPEHLSDELTALATEVVKFRKGEESFSTARARPVRKRQKWNPLSSSELVGALDGLVVYVIHCKDNFAQKQPMRDIIASQVRAIVEKKRLGAQIIAAEPGMYISM